MLLSYQGWQNVSVRHENENALLTLFHALHYARQAAVSRNQIVGVGPIDCPHCEKTWSIGYGVFTYSENTHKKMWLRQYPFSSRITLSSNQKCFLFAPTGNCLSPGTITFTSSTIKQQVIINDSGRPRITLAETLTVSY